MKIKDITQLDEMTLMINHSPNVSDTIDYLRDNNEYVGDLDDLYIFKSIYKNTVLYFASDQKNPEPLSFIQTTIKNDKHILLVAYTLPEHRNKSLK